MTSVAWLPAGACAAFPRGALLTGSRDASMRVWPLGSDAFAEGAAAREAAVVLRGHSQQVAGVAACAAGRVASASLDSTARVWELSACADAAACASAEPKVLSAHAKPVLCVCFLQTSGELLTGSGDATVMRWDVAVPGAAAVRHTYKGHSDSVRGLCELPALGGFASASHDATVAVWALGGDLLRTLAGHAALVYSIAPLPGGLLASGSEDDTMRIWSLESGECAQELGHPGCVWHVAALEDGDVVSCCADGIARVWTVKEERAAPEAERKALDDRVQRRRKEIADAKAGGGGGGGGGAQEGQGGAAGVPPMQDASVLTRPGKKDGEVAVVAEEGKGVAYVYSAAAGGWEKIGVVVDGPGSGAQEISGQGNVLNGVQYDHVFDVDIADGAPVRKLPYNRGQNPYDVAERWLEEQGLPAGYREQVVQFIVDSTGGAAAQAMGGAMDVHDPFTGGGAYVPAGPARGGAGSIGDSASADPFTGGNSYGGSSGGANAGAGASTHAMQQGQYVPLSAPVHAFTQALKVDALLGKLDTFNASLGDDPLTSEFALSAEERAALEAAARAMPGGDKAAAETGASALRKMLEAWPAAKLFPALDLARFAAANATGGAAQALLGVASADALSAAVCRGAGGSGPAALLAARLAAELLAASPSWLESRAGGMIAALVDGAVGAPAANARIARAAALLNACALLKVRGEAYGGGGLGDTLEGACAGLLASEEDTEALFRLATAAGTLAAAPGRAGALIHLKPRLESLAAGGGKAGDAAREALAFIEARYGDDIASDG